MHLESLAVIVHDYDEAIASRRMLAANVTFRGTPRDEAYGRVVVFEDGAGNAWDLLGVSRAGR